MPKLPAMIMFCTMLALSAVAQEETAPDEVADVAEPATAVQPVGGEDVDNAPDDVAADTADETVDVEEDAANTPDEVVADADDGVLDEAFDDETLDEQTYEEDEDDFVPTEEIPADEPIPFPSNI